MKNEPPRRVAKTKEPLARPRTKRRPGESGEPRPPRAARERAALPIDGPGDAHRWSTFALPALAAALLVGFVAWKSGCIGAAPRDPSPTTGGASTNADVDGGATAPTTAPAPLERKHAKGRLVAIGDVHGDLERTRAALRLAGAIDESDAWVGGELTVVQTGDQLDRGDGEQGILDLFERLERDARAAGGAFIALNGNHELMNAALDFRYATPGGLRDFESEGVPKAMASKVGSMKPESRARAAALMPGGKYAALLAARDVIALVDDSVFAHGGVLPSHVAYGLDRMNRETQAFLRGERPPPERVVRDDGPVWTRLYSQDTTDESCRLLGEVLAAVGAKRMFVGHTVQPSGVTSACGDRVWRIDVGLSRHYGGPLQVVELEGGVVRVKKGP